MTALVLCPGTSSAGYLDLVNTSTSGCDAQWAGTECTNNLVWGEEDTLDILTCDGKTAVYLEGVDPSSSTTTAIGFDKESLGTDDSIACALNGWASSASAQLDVTVQWFDAQNTLLSTDTLTAHTGTAGPFGVQVQFDAPAGATDFRHRYAAAVQGGNIFLTLAACTQGDENDAGTCSLECEDDDGNYVTTLYGRGMACPISPSMCPDVSVCEE